MPSESGSVSHSVMSDSFVTPWTVASQAPLSMEFFRQEYQSGQPLPSPGDPPGKPHHLPRVVTLWRIHRHTHKQKCARGAFPGGPVAKTACSRCGGLAQSLVRELDPTPQPRAPVPQLRAPRAARKSKGAVCRAKSRRSQIHK